MSPALVVGIGADLGGDDGVGPAVVRALAERGAPAELQVLGDPTGLVPLLETGAAVIVVDAVVGPEPGAVLTLAPEDLEGRGMRQLSTHGLGVTQAIALARALFPETGPVRIVGIGVAPGGAGPGLSGPVAAAVPRAVAMVMRLLGS